MALDNGLHKTYAANLTSLDEIMSKPTVFLFSVVFFSSFEVTKILLPQRKH